MLSSSFKSNTQIFELPPRLITDTFSFDAYISIFTNPETVRFFINSYVVAGAVTILTLLVAIQAAYAFSRFEFRGKRIVNVIIVSVQAVPPITLLIPYFGLMVGLGLYNTYPGLIFTYMVFTAALRDHHDDRVSTPSRRSSTRRCASTAPAPSRPCGACSCRSRSRASSRWASTRS